MPGDRRRAPGGAVAVQGMVPACVGVLQARVELRLRRRRTAGWMVVVRLVEVAEARRGLLLLQQKSQARELGLQLAVVVFEHLRRQAAINLRGACAGRYF